MTSQAAPNWSRIGRDVLAEYLKWFAAIWLIGVVVAATIIGAVAYLGTPTVSIVDAILNSPRYWLFVLGLVFTYQWLGPFVACGVTRRDFAIGGLIAGLGSSIAAGAICAVTMFAEGRLYAAAGWRADLEQPHLFGSADQIGLMLVEYCVVFGAHFFTGWLLGSLYYRYGAWATITAVPVFGVAVGTEMALGSGWAGRLVAGTGFATSWATSLLVGAAVVAVLYALVWTLVRAVPVVAKRS